MDVDRDAEVDPATAGPAAAAGAAVAAPASTGIYSFPAAACQLAAQQPLDDDPSLSEFEYRRAYSGLPDYRPWPPFDDTVPPTEPPEPVLPLYEELQYSVFYCTNLQPWWVVRSHLLLYGRSHVAAAGLRVETDGADLSHVLVLMAEAANHQQRLQQAGALAVPVDLRSTIPDPPLAIKFLVSVGWQSGHPLAPLCEAISEMQMRVSVAGITAASEAMRRTVLDRWDEVLAGGVGPEPTPMVEYYADHVVYALELWAFYMRPLVETEEDALFCDYNLIFLTALLAYLGAATPWPLPSPAFPLCIATRVGSLLVEVSDPQSIFDDVWSSTAADHDDAGGALSPAGSAAGADNLTPPQSAAAPPPPTARKLRLMRFLSQRHNLVREALRVQAGVEVRGMCQHVWRTADMPAGTAKGCDAEAVIFCGDCQAALCSQCDQRVHVRQPLHRRVCNIWQLDRGTLLPLEVMEVSCGCGEGAGGQFRSLVDGISVSSSVYLLGFFLLQPSGTQFRAARDCIDEARVLYPDRPCPKCNQATVFTLDRVQQQLLTVFTVEGGCLSGSHCRETGRGPPLTRRPLPRPSCSWFAFHPDPSVHIFLPPPLFPSCLGGSVLHVGVFSCSHAACRHKLSGFEALFTQTWFPASLTVPRVVFSKALLDFVIALQRQQARFSVGAAAQAISSLGGQVRCDEEALAFALHVSLARCNHGLV